MKLSKFLGPGWEVRIHENLGWHYSAVNKAKRLYVSQHAGRYMAILGGHWVGHDTSPILAIRSAFLIAKPELENLKAILAVIEEGI